MEFLLWGGVQTDHHDFHALGLGVVRETLVLARRQLPLIGACQENNLKIDLVMTKF